MALSLCPLSRQCVAVLVAFGKFGKTQLKPRVNTVQYCSNSTKDNIFIYSIYQCLRLVVYVAYLAVAAGKREKSLCASWSRGIQSCNPSMWKAASLGP